MGQKPIKGVRNGRRMAFRGDEPEVQPKPIEPTRHRMVCGDEPLIWNGKARYPGYDTVTVTRDEERLLEAKGRIKGPPMKAPIEHAENFRWRYGKGDPNLEQRLKLRARAAEKDAASPSPYGWREITKEKDPKGIDLTDEVMGVHRPTDPAYGMMPQPIASGSEIANAYLIGSGRTTRQKTVRTTRRAARATPPPQVPNEAPPPKRKRGRPPKLRAAPPPADAATQ